MPGPRRQPAAIFDVEGTLVDCVPWVLESWRETLADAGFAFTHADLQRFSGMDGEWMLEKLLPQIPKSTLHELVEQQGKRYRESFIHRARVFPEVGALLEDLKEQGVLIGIATTCKADELEIYDAQMRVVELVDAIVCGEAVQHGKPDPGLFHVCLRKLNTADLAHTLAIGDTPFDVLAARAAGIRAVGVLTGGFSVADFQEVGSWEVLAEVRQVKRIAILTSGSGSATYDCGERRYPESTD